MTAYQAALCGLFASTALFYLLSLFSGLPTTIKEFFHDSNLKLNTISLTVANLALASTLAFILDGTQIFGFLYLLVPISLLAGQSVYGYLVSRMAPPELFGRGTLLTGLDTALNKSAGGQVYFQRIFVFSVGLTYLFALSYEIFVSAGLLATAIAPAPTTATEVLIELLLLTVVMIYTLTGGYRTVQRTDCAQFFFSVTFLLALSGLLISLARHQVPNLAAAPIVPTNLVTLLGFATLALTPFTAQLYGILNHAMASHQGDAKERVSLFRWARIFTFLLLIILAFSALFYNTAIGGNGAKTAVITWVTDNAKSNTATACWLAAFVAAGMGSIIMSTVDTLLITVTQAYYEGIANRDSRNVDDHGQLRNVRLSMVILWPLAFLILGVWWYTKPDTFSILFAIASPCEALAPLIVLLLVLAKRKHLHLIANANSSTYIFLFYFLMAVTLAVALYALSSHQQWTRSVGFCSLVLSSLTSLPAFIKSQRLLRNGE